MAFLPEDGKGRDAADHVEAFPGTSAVLAKEGEQPEKEAPVYRDSNGFALVPQPTRFRDDPLNWPAWLKWLVLLQTSFLAFLGPFNSAVVNPALVPLAKLYHIPVAHAPYQTTTVIIVVGVAPLLWTPLANIYGRRPVYLLSTLIGIVATVGSGVSKSWATLIVGRVFSGVGVGAAMALGAASVNDMFFLHERGTKMGIYTVFLTNGAHVAPVIGGYLAQAASVRWCYFLPAIVNATIFVFMIFALPETLFSRAEKHLAQHQERTYSQMLFSLRRNALLDRRFRLRDMARPFEMLQYPSVTLTFICYTVTFAWASILPAVTVAILFTKTYHFKSGAIGLMLGLPLLIGSALGEFLSGPLSDWFMYRYAKRHDGERKPEARLPAALGSILLCPAGIIIYGVCLQHKTHWIGPVMGMAISSFGLQLVTTVSYAYCSDCYKPQSGEISSLYNFGRQIFAFPLGFYALQALLDSKLQDGAGTRNKQQSNPETSMGHQDHAAHQMHKPSTNYSEATRNFAQNSSRPIPARRGHASCGHSAMEGIDEVVGNPDLTDTPPLSTAADSVEQPAGYFGESSTFNFVLKMGARGADHTQQDPARRRLSTGGSEATFSALGHSPPERRDFSILPPKQLADSLIDAYFLHVHRLYPFVHEPSFRSRYDQMWAQASNEHVEPEPRWMGLLNIVFAHGCEFCDSLPQESSPAVASEFLNRTRKIVYAHVFREGSLELIQALLLMSHYLQGTMELNECWSLVGLMIRTSVSLGFHMNPPESVHSVVEQEMRKRVWWGCYIIDRTLSMKFGRPISTQGAHLYKVDLPLEVDDQYITESSAQPRQPEGRPSLIAFFIQTIKQQSVIENILSNLYNGCPSSAPNVKPLRSLGQLVVLDDELLSWWDNLPAHLKCEPDLPDGPDFRRQRNVIYIRQGYPDSFLRQC
nr:hypothetical protein LTR18_001957 [Exophiala xenobiotica]